MPKFRLVKDLQAPLPCKVLQQNESSQYCKRRIRTDSAEKVLLTQIKMLQGTKTFSLRNPLVCLVHSQPTNIRKSLVVLHTLPRPSLRLFRFLLGLYLWGLASHLTRASKGTVDLTCEHTYQRKGEPLLLNDHKKSKSVEVLQIRTHQMLSRLIESSYLPSRRNPASQQLTQTNTM